MNFEKKAQLVIVATIILFILAWACCGAENEIIYNPTTASISWGTQHENPTMWQGESGTWYVDFHDIKPKQVVVSGGPPPTFMDFLDTAAKVRPAYMKILAMAVAMLGMITSFGLLAVVIGWPFCQLYGIREDVKAINAWAESEDGFSEEAAEQLKSIINEVMDERKEQ